MKPNYLALCGLLCLTLLLSACQDVFSRILPDFGATTEAGFSAALTDDQAGRSDPDFKLRAYLEETTQGMGYSEPDYPDSLDLSKLAACIIVDCDTVEDQRSITVDYAYWNWTNSDINVLTYKNTSSNTYTLPVAENALISIFAPDRNRFPNLETSDEASAFFKRSDWAQLTACYDQITDPGAAWSSPTYFFLCLDADNQVTCIWQDCYYFMNN